MLKTQSHNCKYCSNFRIALYGPMNSGFCNRKDFLVEYNEETSNYERKQILPNGELKTPGPNNNNCAFFKPMMTGPTRKWFEDIFKDNS